jgi:hypothetical protein
MNSRAKGPIGGFFGLALSEVAPVPDSIWNSWTKGRKVVATRTARAALAHLVAYLQPRRVWLPAYVCPEMALAVNPELLRFYPVDDQLSPDCETVEKQVGKNDLLVAVDFFGSLPTPSFRQLVAARPDIHWVEDRGHVLWTAAAPWGEWELYSPRKLVGVPDGGLLVSRKAVDGPAGIVGHVDQAIFVPEIMRFEDQDGTNHSAWYAAYRKREDALTAEVLPISRLTLSLLERISIGPLIARRKRNHSVISKRLSSLAARQPTADDTAPFGFVIKVKDAGALAAELAAEGFFCARHWPKLPSDAHVFALEHSMSQQLLTLPCDHRYEQHDMERLVEAVARLV